MSTSVVKQGGLIRTTLLENATAVIYDVGTTLIASGVKNYKYLIVTYLYGLTGAEYVRMIDTDFTRPYVLDTLYDDANTLLNLGNNPDSLAVLANGSTSGVYIKRIVGIN